MAAAETYTLADLTVRIARVADLVRIKSATGRETTWCICAS